MATKLKISSASKAQKYFQDKMAFTTGPVELERWFKQGEQVNIVDVRAAEDMRRGISLAHSICRRASGITLRS